MLDSYVLMFIQALREITPLRAAKTLFMPILTVIGIPAAVISLLYMLIGVDPKPFVSVFLGDAFDSSLPTIGCCLLAWLGYVVLYTLLLRSGATRYVVALLDHPTPETRMRWCPPVAKWRIFTWLEQKLNRELTSMRRAICALYMAWSAATNPQLE